MPHATADMGDASINGDMPHSSFINHVTSYPVVSDSLETIKKNPYGAKGIDITNQGYATFIKPTFPYLETPYSYAKPYVAKLDEFGDAALSKVDEKVPILKSETSEIKGNLYDLANYPFKVVNDTKEWVFTTYGKEYKKCGGDGIVAAGKAAITTQLVLTSDVIGWVSSFLQAKKEEAKDMAKDAQAKAQS